MANPLRFFFPELRTSLKSPLSRDEIYLRLKKEVSPKRFFFLAPHETFSGALLGDSFKLRRTVHYKNLVAPTILGEIKTAEGGTEIKLKLRLMLAVQLYQMVWVVVLVFVQSTYIYSFARGNFGIHSLNAWVGLIPIALLLFTAGFVTNLFNYEAAAVMEEITRISSSKYILEPRK